MGRWVVVFLLVLAAGIVALPVVAAWEPITWARIMSRTRGERFTSGGIEVVGLDLLATWPWFVALSLSLLVLAVYVAIRPLRR